MENYKEYSAKTVEEALAAALAELNTTEDKVTYEIVDNGSSGFLGLFNKEAKIRVAVKEVSIEEIAKEFLTNVLNAMEIDATVEVNNNTETETIEIQLIGDDMGILIGKRGQTLDSLQYLTSLVINKESDTYLKCKLDTENYRERRKETLENLAKNIASKVKKTHRQVALEPMNPYERRIIHSALQNDKWVETHSEGEEPFRKVVITPKKGMVYQDRNSRYGNRSNGGRGGKYGDKGGYTKKVSGKEFRKKYGEDTKDYSTDYKKDYAAYLEQKAAAKAAEAESNKDN